MLLESRFVKAKRFTCVRSLMDNSCLFTSERFVAHVAGI